MSRNWQLSRRTMLRGLGVSMALPLLDAMLPAGGLVRAAAAATGPAGATGKAAAPVRACFMFMPNGVAFSDWTPTGEGAAWELSKTLAPLAKVKNDLSILSGLALDGAKAHGDGPGDHARGAASFLTGAHAYKTKGRDIKLGVSVDQYAAQKIGDRTRLPSLELGLDKTQTAGDCDSGYSCAYVTNIAWRDDTTPVPKEVDPGSVFDRLVGTGGTAGGGVSKETLEAQAKRLRLRKSVLDFVSEDTKQLERSVGRADQHKLDEFTTSIREIEKRVEAARTAAATGAAAEPPKPDMARPDGIPHDFSQHMRLMCDLLILSWRMDVTRVTTLMIARDGSNRTYNEIGIAEGHHSLSHHGRDEAKIAAVKKIDLYHMEQFAYFIEKLKSTPEGNGSMLDHSMVMLGSGIGDGDRHNHNQLPVVLAGRAGGQFKPGRHIQYSRETPLCNLYVSMLGALGVKTDRFGDSTGPLTGLNG